jgi:ribosomal protein S8
MLEKAKVVMLPTKNASHLFKCHNDYLQYDSDKGFGYSKEDIEYQYLYFINNEEIKVGDWYLLDVNLGDLELMQCFDIYEAERCKSHHVIKNSSKKVVATTNSELLLQTIVDDGFLYNKKYRSNVASKIGLDFVEAYVREQGKITDILLEYFEMESEPGSFKLKARSNGTVVIHHIKPIKYSEEELIEFCMKITGHTRTRESIIEELNKK